MCEPYSLQISQMLVPKRRLRKMRLTTRKIMSTLSFARHAVTLQIQDLYNKYSADKSDLKLV